MIIVNVTYTMKKGKTADEFLSELEFSGFAAHCRREPGNHAYQYHCSADDPEHLYLLEKWDDEAALKTHMETENFAAISSLTERYAADMELNRLDTGV